MRTREVWRKSSQLGDGVSVDTDVVMPSGPVFTISRDFLLRLLTEAGYEQLGDDR